MDEPMSPMLGQCPAQPGRDDHPLRRVCLRHAQYNHSIPVCSKRTDTSTPSGPKGAAFYSYGSVGGARAVELLRLICSELQIAHVRQQLSFSMFTDFENFSTFRPTAAIHDDAATVMFDQLEAWSAALKPLRKP